VRVLRVIPVLLLAACPPARAEMPDSDPRAIQVADQVMKALGGRERWDALPGLRWTFQTATGDTLRPPRRHTWDKHAGLHRVEGQGREGPYVIVHHMDGSAGQAWMNGTPIEGDSLTRLMKRAMSLWINDTYWMLMPYKLRDPGVHLKYDGEAREGHEVYDRLALSFENVGDTPGDRYWVYVNRRNHRVEKWAYVLQGTSPPPQVWTWEGWEEHGGLWFPTVHRNGARTVYTRDVETVHSFPATLFRAP
jgi:hypothetical protein